MRIPDNSGDHSGAVFCFCASILLLLINITLIQQQINTNPGVGIILVIVGIGLFLVMLNMGLFMTRDYWIDSTGVYVRVLKGRIVHRTILQDNIRYFGVILVVSGKFEKEQIFFSKSQPRPNGRGFKIRSRDTVTIDYTPQLYDELCCCFSPSTHTVVYSPRIVKDSLH